MGTKIDTTLSDVFKTTPGGDPRTAIGDTFYGINHRRTQSPIPINRDDHGLILFTRPQLNLTDSNVSAIRQLVPLLTGESVSIQRMVRNVLDPRIELPCPILDGQQAFIPFFTNLAQKLTGWPDPTLESYTSKPGLMGEEFGFADGVIDMYSSYTLTATFRNMRSDPITFAIDSWLTYASAVFRGAMLPYPDMIAMNEVDYNTRIYRVILDQSRRFVQKIAACGAAYPISDTTGQSFNYDADQPRNSANDEIQVNFRCFGYTYNDYILVTEFNNAVGIFNHDMREGNYQTNMRKIDPADYVYFKNRGYPRIDPDTLELQWWVTPGLYESVAAAITRHQSAVGFPLQQEDDLQVD